MFVTFGMLLVGTYTLTKKKSRTATDFPFAKLSNGAVKKVARGWRRVAFQKVYRKSRHIYTVQATIWRDKKLVGFLHNHLVKSASDTTVLRWSPRKKRRADIPSHEVTLDYQFHMNGVDHKDRDTTDWTVSIKTYRFYLRILFWLLDGVLHAMKTIVKHTVGEDLNHKWYEYTKAVYGRYRFQMDLANALITLGLKMDWKDFSDPRPSYMRQVDWVPCACGRCFFCENGLTHGVAHKTTGHKRSYERVDCLPVRETMKHQDWCSLCTNRIKRMHPTYSSKQVNKARLKSRKGCVGCDKWVCATCWSDFEHGTV